MSLTFSVARVAALKCIHNNKFMYHFIATRAFSVLYTFEAIFSARAYNCMRAQCVFHCALCIRKRYRHARYMNEYVYKHFSKFECNYIVRTDCTYIYKYVYMYICIILRWKFLKCDLCHTHTQTAYNSFNDCTSDSRVRLAFFSSYNSASIFVHLRM